MLKFFRRFERARNWILIFFIALMGISLIIFYAPGRSGINNANASTSKEVVARVGSGEVTVGDVVSLKESYQRMFGGQLSIAQLGGSRALLDGLIRDRIVAQEAMRLGLAPSDAEVASQIRKTFSDPKTGAFIGVEKYKQQVGDIDKYEQQVRDSLAAEKLRAYITAAVTVSPEEVQDKYKRENTTFNLVYVPITADKLAARIQPSEQDLQNYYEQHKADFRILEPQKKIRYVFIDQNKVGEKLNISDEDLRKEYDSLPPDIKNGGAHIQQIVLKIAKPDLDASVQAKANEIVQNLRSKAQDGKVSEDAFAEAARGNSEDPATAKEGGKVAGVVRKNVSKPDDPYQRALGLQDGEITEPIKYKNAYYIIRRMDTVPKTFEDSKQELLVSLRNRRSYAEAAKLAERAANLLKETKDPQKVANELAKDANMTPAEMVRETGYIKPGDDVPNIGSSPQFEQAIEPLKNANDVGDRVSIKGGFAVPMLVDVKPPRDPDLSEVKDKVAEKVKLEKATAQLEQTAREIANQANDAASLKAVAEKYGLKAETTENYKTGSPLPNAGTSPAIDSAVYNLKQGEVDKTPIKNQDGSYVVVGVTQRKEADLAEFAKQRDELTERMLSERRSLVYEDYIAATRARWESEGKIKIYDDALKAAMSDEDEMPTLPRQPRRSGR
jgi:peptidyl-prolyl cis-trans isomerase D